MKEIDDIEDLKECILCEHRCGVNRMAGETGVCRVTLPTIASAALHPAPPESYTVFMAGCNYKCLNCQNWTISQYPDNGSEQRGFEDPDDLAAECATRLNSISANRMGADRIFFSGGEPTIYLPYIERVIEAARKLNPDTRVNFDTNGYMTEQSLMRILDFTTSITFDLKAYNDEVHRALTGASSQPVLRNAEYIGKRAKEILWEYRITVIPQINENEIKPLSEFIANIDTTLPVCFLSFRPNFALEHHKGADRSLMDSCVEIARESGLENISWSGYTGLDGAIINTAGKIEEIYLNEGARIAASYALHAGCKTHPRDCSTCPTNQSCKLKRYIPVRIT
ncbi:radical SAM protein [Thermodesulfobacteriota bacterium]